MRIKQLIWLSVYLAVYLSLTMLLFEKINLTPESVGGFLQWMGVEFVRAFAGLLIFKSISGGKNDD